MISPAKGSLGSDRQYKVHPEMASRVENSARSSNKGIKSLLHMPRPWARWIRMGSSTSDKGELERSPSPSCSDLLSGVMGDDMSTLYRGSIVFSRSGMFGIRILLSHSMRYGQKRERGNACPSQISSGRSLSNGTKKGIVLTSVAPCFPHQTLNDPSRERTREPALCRFVFACSKDTVQTVKGGVWFCT